MPDGWVFDEQAMDYVPAGPEYLPRCALVKRVAELEQRLRQCIIQAHASNEIDAAQRRIAELEAERDAARAWGRLWKRAATVERGYPGSMRSTRWCVRKWLIKRINRLPDATTPDGR